MYIRTIKVENCLTLSEKASIKAIVDSDCISSGSCFDCEAYFVDGFGLPHCFKKTCREFLKYLNNKSGGSDNED